MTSPLDSAASQPMLPLSSGLAGSGAPMGNGQAFRPSSMFSASELHDWAMKRGSQLFGSTATPQTPTPAPAPNTPSTNTGGNNTAEGSATNPNSENANSIPTANQVTQFMLYSFELTCFYMFQGNQSFAQEQAQDRQNLQPET